MTTFLIIGLMAIGVCFSVDPATLCKDVLTLDCTSYIPLDIDESVCGSDGKHYNNFCYFSQARCHDLSLTVASLGNCGTLSGGSTPRPTPPPVTSKPTTSTTPSTTTPTTTTTTTTTTTASTTRTTHTLSTKPTTPPTTSTTTISTTTSTKPTPPPTKPGMSTTTEDPVVGIFCANKDHIICPPNIDLVCGSDKKFYRNDCDFSKHHCDDKTLVKVDISICRG